MTTVTIDLVQVSSPQACEAAARLINEYLAWVAGVARAQYGLQFDVEGMSRSDIEDKTKFFPPSGRLYLVRQAGRPVGVGALKQLSPGTCELQRMYVQASARGLGAGRLLLERLLADARGIGYTLVRLESLKALSSAHALYRSAGFEDIEPYAENSMRDYQPPGGVDRYRACALFMELKLPPAAPGGT